MTSKATPRRKPNFPGSLTDLHRFRKTVHGHDGSSRIVMVRKTDQRTFSSTQKGQEPKLETITRETIETFRGERTACKITTEKKGERIPTGILGIYDDKSSPRKIASTLPRPIRNNKNGIWGCNETVGKSTLTKGRKTPDCTRTSNMGQSISTTEIAGERESHIFAQEMLKLHNEIRAKHGASPLKLSKELVKVSQNYAEKLVRTKILQSSGNHSYGENIYSCSSSDFNKDISAKDAIDNWYSAIDKYDFCKESNTSCNLTQIIWGASDELGVGYAKNNGKTIVVCNYAPPGNITGQFLENVKPLGSKISFKSVIERDIAKGTEGNFVQEFLDAHNKFRRMHNVPDLTLDHKLCKYSEEWANMLSVKNVLEHRKNNQYGENIFSINSTNSNITIAGNIPVDSWYAEIKDHTFGKEPHGLKSGHFTQVIWKTSTAVGVGIAKKNGQIIVVANYSPAGNFVGHFTENVLPLYKGSNLKTHSISDITEKSSSLVLSKFTRFEIEGLLAHNELRKKHGCPPLKLSRDLCEMATSWAKQCSDVSKMAHRPGNDLGENIFCAYSTDFAYTATPTDAVHNWYNEIKDHKFGVEAVNVKTLHFTQVIWKSSKKLGIGFFKNNKGETFIIAYYSPRGNIGRQFRTNVPVYST